LMTKKERCIGRLLRQEKSTMTPQYDSFIEMEKGIGGLLESWRCYDRPSWPFDLHLLSSCTGREWCIVVPRLDLVCQDSDILARWWCSEEVSWVGMISGGPSLALFGTIFLIKLWSKESTVKIIWVWQSWLLSINSLPKHKMTCML
jgi:hypothetical protein